MKKFLLAIMALCILLCVVGCVGTTEPPTMSTTVTSELSTTSTTFVKNNSDENKAAEARLEFEFVLLVLNDAPIEINDDDTIEDIVEGYRAEGSYIEVNCINENARFFDYAMENPSYAEGGSFYVLREDANWLALYVE